MTYSTFSCNTYIHLIKQDALENSKAGPVCLCLTTSTLLCDTLLFYETSFFWFLQLIIFQILDGFLKCLKETKMQFVIFRRVSKGKFSQEGYGGKENIEWVHTFPIHNKNENSIENDHRNTSKVFGVHSFCR